MSEQDVAQVLAHFQELMSTDQAAALEWLEQALVKDAQPEYYVALAAVAFHQRNLVNALNLLRPLTETSSVLGDVPEILAVLYCFAGRTTEALFYAKLGTVYPPTYTLTPLFGSTFPTFAKAFEEIIDRPLFRSGMLHQMRGQLEQALQQYEQHLQLFPNDVQALDAYAEVLVDLGKLEQAITILRSVMTIAGPSATLYGRLGKLLVEAGRWDEGLACHKIAVTRGQKSIPLWADYVDCMSKLGETGKEYEHAVQVLMDLLEAKAIKTDRPPVKASAPSDVLVVGILVADLSNSVLRKMVADIAGAFDDDRVRVIGFGAGELSRDDNVVMRNCFDNWVVIDDVDPLTLSVIIENEGVDVLLDAQGLWGNTMNVFRRPGAGLQWGWLNQPAGVLFPGLDAQIADILGLSPYYLDVASVDTPLPALAGQPITFGADIPPHALTADVMAAFAVVLHQCPHASLVLRDRGLSKEGNVARLLEYAGNSSIAHRIDLIDLDHLPSFWAAVDIALVPEKMVEVVSYGQALAMGVPLVCWANSTLERIQNTVLDTPVVGAESFYEYGAIAAHLAQDIAGLALMRKELVARAKDAKAFSAKAFANALEAEMRHQLARKHAQDQQ